MANMMTVQPQGLLKKMPACFSSLITWIKTVCLHYCMDV